jgi:superfamily II DNA or RNA helicase
LTETLSIKNRTGNELSHQGEAVGKAFSINLCFDMAVCPEKFDLKPEQKQAVDDLLSGKDVLAILPTGFGKSLIFQTFTSVKNEETYGRVVVLVISPLTSIVQDQLSKLNSLGLQAADLSSATMDELNARPPV